MRPSLFVTRFGDPALELRARGQGPIHRARAALLDRDPRPDAAELAAELGWITVPDPIPLRRPSEESPAEDRA
jgi:hypothetical protein